MSQHSEFKYKKGSSEKLKDSQTNKATSRVAAGRAGGQPHPTRASSGSGEAAPPAKHHHHQQGQRQLGPRPGRHLWDEGGDK